MGTQYLLNISITIILAIAGWIVAHYFTSTRDLRNRRLELRTKYLIDLYYRLDISIGRKITAKTLCDLEDIICYLQLFAENKKDIQMVIDVCSSLAGDKKSQLDITILQKYLLNIIRNELKLEKYTGTLTQLRLTIAGKDPRTISD